MYCFKMNYHYMKILLHNIIILLLHLHNFTYRALTYLTPHLEPDGLHPKHRLTNYHQFFLDNISPSDVVLDVGCGNGALTHDIAAKAKAVVGVDINPRNIKEANKKKRKNITFLCYDIFSMLESLNRYDVVVLSNVLEHLTRRSELLSKLKLIAPKLLIRVPMSDRDWLTLYKKEKGISYMLDPTHKVEYTLKFFEEELICEELKIDSYRINYGEIWGVIVHA